MFESSRRKLRKGAKSSYADWCIKHGFRYYDKEIPEDWLREKGKAIRTKFIDSKGRRKVYDLNDYVVIISPALEEDVWRGDVEVNRMVC